MCLCVRVHVRVSVRVSVRVRARAHACMGVICYVLLKWQN